MITSSPASGTLHIPADPLPGPLHDKSRGPLLGKKHGHVFHIGFNMLKVVLESFTECIKSRFTALSLHEPVLRTFTPAGEVIFAPHAVTRQSVPLVDTKFKLLRALVKQ